MGVQYVVILSCAEKLDSDEPDRNILFINRYIGVLGTFYDRHGNVVADKANSSQIVLACGTNGEKLIVLC